MRSASRGFSFVEVLVALVLAAAVGAIAMQALRALGDARREQARRFAAQEEAANVMEQLMAVPWERLQPTSKSAAALSAEARQALPGAALDINIDEAERARGTAPAGRRLTVVVSWDSPVADERKEARLVAWRFAP